ncbi:DNA repair protein RecO [Lactobacillus nasalidis]|uniref:DNA repair protein RecO n=1 Tax=Lactobacillus nasalidis TaxID=2797258 RepID=A0ABQ3W6X1_9LACO|nr:DNA repair protein RecO [Lactobacillus nasalidis]GHV98235.1 DNA repair protein RecO [Lactobacillus nasalidis]GHV98834.1 DNA repair protein RecO [Lactobacillus nasalidis]GHW01064.1 DNA repair protein RecO [Lactobacillus nasalidis]
MAAELLDVHGLLFKRQKYKEADLLAKLWTKELGIVTVIIKGGMRPKSRLAAAVLPFTEGTFGVLTRRQGISQLRTYKKLRQHDELFTDLDKSAYLSYLFDLADHAFSEYQNLGSYYQLLMGAFDRIVAGQDPEIIAQIVQLQLLAAFGVAPQLAACVICGKEQGIFDYSLSLGGVVCSDHFRNVDRLHLSPKAAALIRTLGLLPLERLGQIQLDEPLKKESRRAVAQIYQATVDLNLPSLRFLNEVRGG